MKRVIYLAIAALVALMILVPTAMSQELTVTEEKVMEKTGLPPSGGPAPVGSILLPAAALLIGSGVLAYAVLKRRR